MSEDSGSERTEEATAKRRQDFREKGQVAQSKEVATAALMTLSLLLWVFYAGHFWHDLQQMFDATLRHLNQMPVTVLGVLILGEDTLLVMARLLWPIFMLTLIVGFLVSFAQVGPLLTAKPFMPDLSKFNPIKGMGRMFSKRSAVELVKSLAKVVLVGAVAYNTISNEFSGALGLLSVDLSQTIAYLGNTAYLVMAKTCGILIVLGAIDYLFTRWEMEQKMKMTKQEVKEEYKETEGDPQLKARVRSMQQQMARRRMMAEVPKADVIITNPTHLSIAISYVRDEMDAPKMLAKGADHLAFRIREIARENKIPVVENKPVARALYKLEIGESIPEEMFKAVAEILAYVYSVKQR
jgi:flagellar biosynthetic protein FlhB